MNRLQYFFKNLSFYVLKGGFKIYKFSSKGLSPFGGGRERYHSFFDQFLPRPPRRTSPSKGGQFPLLSLLLLFSFTSTLSLAQDESYHFKDYNYVTNVKSVKFYNADLDLSYPIVDLENGYLTLNFDDIEGDVKDYRYKIIHCDGDWTPSDLTYFDFVERFDEADIENYEFSMNTVQQYTNFELVLPNNDVKWTKSGNYLLIVFDDTIENPIITRRFVVVEPLVNIQATLSPASVLIGRKTHQEVDFFVDFEGVNLRNPISTIKAAILQNGRWDNAITNQSPRSIDRQVLNFDHQGKIVFPGGKEWRFVDLQGFEYPVPQITVEKTNDGYYVGVNKEYMRGLQPYSRFRDLNGSFVINNTDFVNQLRADYGSVFFQLDAREYESKDVYMFGELTNWEIHDDFQLKFSPALNAYVTKQLMKQGYYNYAYALVDKETKKVDFTDSEGNHFETDNAYSILLYYRPVGERYDRVIGGTSFFSSNIPRN